MVWILFASSCGYVSTSVPSSRVLLDASQLCFPFLPTTFPLDKVRVIEMQRSVWEKDREFSSEHVGY